MSRIFFKKGERRPSVFSTLGFLTACLAGLALVAVGPAYQIEFLNPSVLDPADMDLRNKILHVATRLVLVAGGFAVAGIIHGQTSPRVRTSWRGVVAALLVAAFGYVVWVMETRIEVAGPLYDVSTNLEAPPSFIALDVLEQDDFAITNPQYKARHKQAYGDLLPITLSGTVETATRDVTNILTEMGFQIVASSLSTGHIEARYHAPWFGFDSVLALRVRGNAASAILDIRAASRLGTANMGVNAELIRDIRDAINARRS
ncbi:DUF1499 domain-containing protein [Kordiimonas sp.]|uniref:DUF1499 domain-containing protein n=1 Tax=Kordiimonas sp. TaxID=1970157 RepID=UPI003A9277A3